MLIKERNKAIGKTLYRSKPLLLTPAQTYVRPSQGRAWFATTTSVWRVDELIRRTVRDWKRMMDETGHTGTRAQSFRRDHDSVYTATHSVFPAPLMEWIILRYGGPMGSNILDCFAGGPVRGVVCSIMGHKYHGVDVRKDQIDENEAVLRKLKLEGATYYHTDGCLLEGVTGPFDAAITCPPYHDLEKYSSQEDDISNLGSYWEFNAMMAFNALAQFEVLKPEAFCCIVVGLFRNKKTGELIDFRSHTVENFREAGFIFWQEIVLSKNFGSAAQRSTNAWRGMKLVPAHEYLLVFRKPK